MELPLDHLRTLSAAVDAGTLERAATRLGITPSAVSQRIRAIEQRVGRIVLLRGKPIRITEAGAPLLRLARQLTLLEQDALTALGDDAVTSRVSLAVNSDSLLTWFMPVLESVAEQRSVAFELHREDQDRTAELLIDGTVMGAVTAQRDPVPGCTSSPLGQLRYLAIAERSFARRWFPQGVTQESLQLAPLVDFDRHDTLQDRFARGFGSDQTGPRHIISASAEYARAVTSGLGWGMLMPGQFEDGVAEGRLVQLSEDVVTVPLWWQRWNLNSALLDTVTRAVESAARASSSLDHANN